MSVIAKLEAESAEDYMNNTTPSGLSREKESKKEKRKAHMKNKKLVASDHEESEMESNADIEGTVKRKRSSRAPKIDLQKLAAEIRERKLSFKPVEEEPVNMNIDSDNYETVENSGDANLFDDELSSLSELDGEDQENIVDDVSEPMEVEEDEGDKKGNGSQEEEDSKEEEYVEVDAEEDAEEEDDEQGDKGDAQENHADNTDGDIDVDGEWGSGRNEGEEVDNGEEDTDNGEGEDVDDREEEDVDEIEDSVDDREDGGEDGGQDGEEMGEWLGPMNMDVNIEEIDVGFNREAWDPEEECQVMPGYKIKIEITPPQKKQHMEEPARKEKAVRHRGTVLAKSTSSHKEQRDLHIRKPERQVSEFFLTMLSSKAHLRRERAERAIPTSLFPRLLRSHGDTKARAQAPIKKGKARSDLQVNDDSLTGESDASEESPVKGKRRPEPKTFTKIWHLKKNPRVDSEDNDNDNDDSEDEDNNNENEEKLSGGGPRVGGLPTKIQIYWVNHIVPTMLRWAGAQEDPWTIDPSHLTKALETIGCVYVGDEYKVDEDSLEVKVAYQCLSDAFRSPIQTTAVWSLINFFDSHKTFGNSTRKRQTWATHQLQLQRFMYWKAKGDNQDAFYGRFLRELILHTFAVYLKAIEGSKWIDGLSTAEGLLAVDKATLNYLVSINTIDKAEFDTIIKESKKYMVGGRGRYSNGLLQENPNNPRHRIVNNPAPSKNLTDANDDNSDVIEGWGLVGNLRSSSPAPPEPTALHEKLKCSKVPAAISTATAATPPSSRIKHSSSSSSSKRSASLQSSASNKKATFPPRAASSSMSSSSSSKKTSDSRSVSGSSSQSLALASSSRSASASSSRSASASSSRSGLVSSSTVAAPSLHSVHSGSSSRKASRSTPPSARDNELNT
ncbi:hypothetical protein NP233_g6563 [Leucocoprinus birnbaumii]|uniref:Uncharacterized protein n=1 Tax=Leucocoprinus birnbaumii TaxID=56174 RepID=A0AAD5YVF1_9AGAR|nr:hypothetical protein NP233_g6563 [Leucocoprinus birnbaumii]